MTSHTPEPIPNRPTLNSFGAVALYYHAQGLNLIPGYPERKEPFKTGQGHVFHLQAKKGVRLTPDEILGFWERWPLANILMFPGLVSGVDVVDVDTKPGQKSGFETLKEHGLDWVIKEALLVFTPTGRGLHLYFLHTVDSPKNKKPPGTGLELFCAGNQYVVMPPSIYFDTDAIPHQYGQYTCNDFRPDHLKPVPPKLVQFFLDRPTDSPEQKLGGYKPKGDYGKLPPPSPPIGTMFTPTRSTLIRVGLTSQREWREANSLKHLASNTGFLAKVRALKAEVIQLQGQNLEPNLLQQALNRIEQEAHSTLSHLFKKRNWFMLEDDDGTINGWIFKFKGRWHWVGIPGTKHDGIEVVPTPEELASQRGKRTRYIIRDEGTILVRFTKHSGSGKTSDVGWYLLDNREYPELDEFI